MTTTENRLPCQFLKKFGAEIMPSSSFKRGERVRSISSSSFEEITETEEEEQVQSTSFTQSKRSPFAQAETQLLMGRNSSLVQNALLSPKFIRRSVPPKLLRGYSDSQLLPQKKLDSSSIHVQRKDRKLAGSREDALPSIPESTANHDENPIEQEEKDKE